MSKNSFKSIGNGVIASVIAGVALVALPIVRGYAARFFLWLWSGLIWCWEALLSSHSLPGWAWLVIFFLALIGLINICIRIKGEAEPPYKSYVEDFLYGAKWRWHWTGNRISNIWCFCPTCDATLVYNDSAYRLSDVRKTDFICENCGNRVIATVSGGDKTYAIGAVEREVLRRIRTEEYKKR